MKSVLVPLLTVLTVTLAVGEDFESGFALPEGWQAEGPVEVSEAESVSGSRALKVEPEGSVQYGPKGAGVYFVDLQVLPVAGEGVALNVSGAQVGFDAEGKILAFPAEGVGRALRHVSYEVSEGAGSSWLRLTVRIDAEKNEWDVFVDGKPAESGLPLPAAASALTATGHGTTPIFIDDFVQSAENPLFEDNDKDGMPDAEEKANGLNAFGNDRDGDLDADGISNVAEFFAGTSPRAPGALSSEVAQLVYVDNLHGSDANSGLRSYAIGVDGPKASLKAAMAAAPAGSTIIVLKGRGLYDEGSRGAEGKSLTIKPVDPVTIR